MTARRGNQRAVLALLVMILLWAYSWTVMKQMTAYSGPFEFAALRYLGGAVFLFLVMFLARAPLKPPPLRLTIAVGACQTTAFQALAQWAIVSGGAGHVSILSYTMPFWVVLFAWWLLRERPNAWQWAGIALAAAGLVCVIEPWQALGNAQSIGLALTGGACWALGTVLSKRMFELYAPHPLTFTAWQMLAGSLILGLIALAVPAPPISWNLAFIAGLGYSIVFASSIAWLLWLYVVNHLPTTIASLSSLGTPVMAVLLAWAILGERPDGAEFLGIALILAGLVAVSGSGRRLLRHALRRHASS